jgi:hypothetical protein
MNNQEPPEHNKVLKNVSPEFEEVCRKPHAIILSTNGEFQDAINGIS